MSCRDLNSLCILSEESNVGESRVKNKNYK